MKIEERGDGKKEREHWARGCVMTPAISSEPKRLIHSGRPGGVAREGNRNLRRGLDKERQNLLSPLKSELHSGFEN